ncbi:MAG: hypothetical protein LLF80_00645 [Porphyromonadaceae bacterium]|nr:hypothetical protein [Porphyromonadaceae bacterium]
MNAKTIINFDGLTFLDELETIYGSHGMEGVIKLATEQIPIGQTIRLQQHPDPNHEIVYRIERVVISSVDQGAMLWSMGNTLSGSLIRSMQLPYVDIPFQIEIYGRPDNTGITSREDV